MKTPSLAIIILNWNGWNDTCECFSSLMESSYQDFQIICIDNGSTDESINKIRAWSRGEILQAVGPGLSDPKRYHVELVEFDLLVSPDDMVIPDQEIFKQLQPGKICLFKSPVNLGFAKGCNVGIQYAINAGFDCVFLLNNDTTLKSESLGKLVLYMNRRQDVSVLTPKILYYHEPGVIWNCGGRLTWTGRRSYFGFGDKNSRFKQTGHKRITFITGCALFSRIEIFKKFGLLTEKFFFGEEDYEFSLRMKSNKIIMESVLSAIIYHKVTASNKDSCAPYPTAYFYNALLNRYIDLKWYYLKWHWEIWRLLSLIYIIPMLIFKHRINIRTTIHLVRHLLKMSRNKNSVNREDFISAKSIFY